MITMTKHTLEISDILAGRKSISKAEPLVGVFYEAWRFGESTSFTDRKQKDNVQPSSGSDETLLTFD